MAFDFPTAPAVNDEYTIGGILYQWDGLVWGIKGGSDPQDYVLKAGDTMTGTLQVKRDVGGTTIGLLSGDVTNAGRLEWTNVDGTRKAYFGYGPVGSVELTLDSATIFDVKGGDLAVRAGSIYAQGGGRFIFNNTDNNAWQNGLSLGNFHIQYIQGGNNDTKIRFWSANGGYSDNWVLQTTVVNGAPGIEVNGSVRCGSGDAYGFFVGDSWHGWVWSNTSNGEHLRSYQGKFEFRKTNAVTPGELLGTIDAAGIHTNMINGNGFLDRSLLSNPELEPFVEGEDESDLARRGVNLGALLLHALDRIKTLEGEVATLRGTR